MMIALIGPTCSGKSSLAVELAKKFNFEIINCDAFQVYKELNIGTAKPTIEERKSVKTHLYDCISINDKFNIFLFQKAFRYLIDKLSNEGKNILIVGGSGLYLRAGIYDYSFSEELKEMDLSKYDDKSNEELYNLLLSKDAVSAAKIHPNNRKRVIRALEIFENTGISKSNIEERQDHKLIYNINLIGIDLNRDDLYKRINERVDQMFASGLPNEATKLFNENSHDLQGLQAIGYKEFLENLPLEETRELIKLNSRRYAKRQMTFFKHQFENVAWFSDKDKIFDYVSSLFKTK